MIKAEPAPPPPGDDCLVSIHTGATMAYSSSLAYCATLGGAFDHDQRSLPAVDDVTIIDHFVK